MSGARSNNGQWPGFWLRGGALSLALAPAAGLFCAAAWLRRALYRGGVLRIRRFPVPVIVVGNITVGGAGKTPLVIWLVSFLQRHGYRPGVVSRGYGGHASRWPQQVRRDSDPRVVGDEAVFLARACACPMAVAPERPAAVEALLAHTDCDVVIADDGLQHYRLGRDLEIAVLDGERGFGNGRCLPAGPLRERPRRLEKVDLVVTHRPDTPTEETASGFGFRLVGEQAVNVVSPTVTRRLRDWPAGPVHAVAGIGNPERFFAHLRGAGLEVVAHPFPDHHRFRPEDVRFGDSAPVLMTEKDAVKCRWIEGPDYWTVPVEAQPDEGFGAAVVDRLRRCARMDEAHHRPA